MKHFLHGANALMLTVTFFAVAIFAECACVSFVMDVFDAPSHLLPRHWVYGESSLSVLSFLAIVGGFWTAVFYLLLLPVLPKLNLKLLNLVLVLFIAALVLGPVASWVTGQCVVASDFSKEDTIGVVHYCGFPVWFYEEAPGLSSMSGWQPNRWALNTLIWTTASLTLALMGYVAIRRWLPALKKTPPHANDSERSAA